MKTITIACVGLMIALGAQYGNTAEVKIDFQHVSGGGYTDSSMITSASGIDGDIHWTSTSPSYPGIYSTDYFLTYLIDDFFSEGYTDGYYWLTANSRPTLRIVFPEEVYITKIRTYNFVTYNAGPRWAENTIWISTDGITYSEEGNVTLDTDPSYMDYVDVDVNDYVLSVEFRATNSGSFYAMNGIEMYTDNAAGAVPEPASISLLLIASLAGLVRKKLNR